MRPIIGLLPVDTIDPSEAFATPIITTLSPGILKIPHSGELLIDTVTTGTLTDADFG